jgi:hypothetical protein
MIRLTRHAQEAIEARGISIGWVEATVSSPDSTAPDPRHRERTRSYKAIAQFGGRILRVVHRRDGTEDVIITVHFDRGAKP